MASIQLQPRPLYGIGTVARLTGIKPDTLRIWERRYQLGASHKSSSGRRQYTQADLEHLQLVAALVSEGARIGEIASTERRTLEMLLRARSDKARSGIPEPKPRILFVGEGLCDWLEEHQGCLVNVNALLAPCAVTAVDERLLEDIGDVDGLVAECGGLNGARLEALKTLAASLKTSNVLALHQCSSERWRSAIEALDFTSADYPPDAAFLAFHLTRSSAEKAANAGSANLGDLVHGRPRLFNEQELSAARGIEDALACECPKHLTDLVRALATFEEYSAGCSVENWEDASVHACVFAYAGQARWLMEKALGLVVDSHSDEKAA
ncbi:MAG: MerR family transcriptional regulator [Halioglobus sp.]|nr:MerR family transcriptional regulator [Halioglobus sp.]